ncbi:MAG: LysM peptidoglycan-binding domain-containing protein [Chloroflexota bacterium]
MVNQFRVDNGLPPFQTNNALLSAAQNQANYMAEFSVFSSHVGYGGSTPQTRADAAGYGGFVVENIVGGSSMTPWQGLNWWRNSPIHYNTLVTTRYSEAGTAFATNGTENFFVLVVGRRSNDTSTPNEDTSPAPLIVAPSVLATPNEDGSIVHMVQEGQALWSLAAYYEVPLTDILLFNNFSDTHFIQPGDDVVIQLAEGQAPPPTPTPPTTHIVQSGQSLWSLALLYDIKFADLLLFNGLNETSLLQPGDELIIRLAPGEAPPPTPTPIVFHTISTGQTLWDIALSYGLDLDGLLALNEGLTADSILQPGDQLQVSLPLPTPLPTLTPTAVSNTATPSATPNEAAVSTPEGTEVAQLDLATTETPSPLAIIEEENGRQSVTPILYGMAVIFGIIGIAFIWWSRQEQASES